MLMGMMLAMSVNSVAVANQSSYAAPLAQASQVKAVDAVNVDLGESGVITALDLSTENVISVDAGTNGVSTVVFLFSPENGLPLDGIDTIDEAGNVRALTGWWKMISVPVGAGGITTLTLPQRTGRTANVQWFGW